MKKYCSHGLWLIFILIHLSFYLSALVTDHLQHFFVEGTIQAEKTLDYSQIPNGAQTYFEGGPITGSQRSYPVLPNVYHPATTIILGGFLQVFDISAGFVVYTLLKLGMTVWLAKFLMDNYGKSSNPTWAMFLFATPFTQGVDIACGQYHFLLNFCIFLFLHGLIQSKSTRYLSGCYFASLMVKPIGLLWAPQLLVDRRYRVVCWSLGLFVALTGACWFMAGGNSYLIELLRYSKNPILQETTANSSGTVIYDIQKILPNGGRYTLETLLRYLGASAQMTQFLKYSFPMAILALNFWKRIPIFSALFMWTCFYLFFFSRVYIYHYTTLIPFFVLGVLTQDAFKGPFVKAMMLISCLPSPYLLYKWLDVFVEGPPEGPHQVVTAPGIFLMICLRLLPVLLIVVSLAFKQQQLVNDPDCVEFQATHSSV